MLNKLFRRFEEEFVGQSKVHEPAKDTIYYGRISDAELEAMRKRNEAAIEMRIKELGDKWLLHPSHKVQRIEHGHK